MIGDASRGSLSKYGQTVFTKHLQFTGGPLWFERTLLNGFLVALRPIRIGHRLSIERAVNSSLDLLLNDWNGECSNHDFTTLYSSQRLSS